jgi:hypothetical protein
VARVGCLEVLSVVLVMSLSANMIRRSMVYPRQLDLERVFRLFVFDAPSIAG